APAPTPPTVVQPTEATAPAPAPTPAPTANKPKPEIGVWGFDQLGMDAQVTPGDSFYAFANGAWLKTTPIPADKSNYGMFTVLSDRSDERTKAIILGASGAAGTEAKKIGDYYASFMDEATIEQKGLAPLQPTLDKIAAIKDQKALVAAFADNTRHFVGAPFRA